MLRELRFVGTFTGAYLLIALFFAFRSLNWEFVYYIGVVVLLIFVTLFVHHRVHLRSGLLWALSLWGLLHMIGGLLPAPEGWAIAGDTRVFYSLWLIPDLLKYDQVIHAYGFGVATWLCFEALKSAQPNVRSTLGILALCALAGMGLGALNEIVEFIAVIIVPETNVGGYENTGWDLVFNMVGAVIAAFILRSRA